MRLTRIALWGALASLACVTTATAEPQARGGASDRSAYSYVREATGGVTVISEYNGRVAARRNLPIVGGDAIDVTDGSRAEIALADGNLLHVGGGTRARFVRLRDQQGENDQFTAIDLEEGSVVLTATGTDEGALPRIDTEDATVYLTPGARARVNVDPRRGTVVIARSGTMEVRTRAGSHTLNEGQYLMAQGDEEPEIARGTFSRDRFDLWAAERVTDLYETHSASARYVDDEYDSEVVALDGYGDWTYSDTYSTNVWTPRVSVGWTPYSYGSWYNTPIGMTWWSYDPWGWYPHHYGNWYFDAGWSRWSWIPSHAYSPAWVYWAYTPSYVGWCPTGYYSYYSPWYSNYYRRWGMPSRGGVSFGIHGTFNTRNVDFRGWNFVGSGDLGRAVARMDVIPGSRIVDRLGDRIAVSSRPFVVETRGASARDAIRDHIREAPRMIERTSNPDSGRMGPVLARERQLSADTQEALRGRSVVTRGSRLSGPGASDIAPRGAFIERGRTVGELWARDPRGSQAAGRAAEGPGRESGQGSREVLRSRPAREIPDRGESIRGTERAPAPSAARPAQEGWRGRGREVPAAEGAPEAPRSEVRRDRGESRRPEPAQSAPVEQREWRTRGRSQTDSVEAPASEPRQSPSERGWRSRSEAPPAVRIIEGAVPGRRSVESREAPQGRVMERPAESRWEARPSARARDAAPAPEYRRAEPPRVRESARPQRDAPSPRSVERSSPPPPPQVRSQAPPPAPRPPADRESGRGRKH